jgi:pimeloyl-ACP methyl ester carboxylesterase
VLNTLVEVDTFQRPWPIEPFARRGLGEAYLRTLSKPAFRLLMRRQGVQDPAAVPRAEVDAYLDLLRLGDGGQAFLKIMRGFERTRAKRDLYRRVLGDGRYPVQVVWGASDPALKLTVEGEAARRAAGTSKIHTVPAKHFLQEDQAPAVAEHIAHGDGLIPAGRLMCRQAPHPVARSCQSKPSCRAVLLARSQSCSFARKRKTRASGHWIKVRT